jgi:hypothetical protein
MSAATRSEPSHVELEVAVEVAVAVVDQSCSEVTALLVATDFGMRLCCAIDVRSLVAKTLCAPVMRVHAHTCAYILSHLLH